MSLPLLINGFPTGLPTDHPYHPVNLREPRVACYAYHLFRAENNQCSSLPSSYLCSPQLRHIRCSTKGYDVESDYSPRSYPGCYRPRCSATGVLVKHSRPTTWFSSQGLGPIDDCTEYLTFIFDNDNGELRLWLFDTRVTCLSGIKKPKESPHCKLDPDRVGWLATRVRLLSWFRY